MELIYTLHENGQIAELKNRAQVHRDGTLHSSVQCWVMNEAGHVLIQRRADTKNDSPGKWDVSFGGHCTATPNNTDILIHNVIKEGAEELGLTLNSDILIKLGEMRYTSRGGTNREIIGVFLTHVSNDQKFTFKDGEVSKIAWINLTELQQRILNNPDEYANRLGALTLLQHYMGD